MSYTTKNYTEQGAEKTVINGTLEIKNGGILDVQTGATVNGIVGTAAVAACQEDSTAEDVTSLVADFNSLLTKLKTAGIMASN